MIKFLFKGLIRDKSRSFFPFLVVVAGVTLTVLLYCWINGVGGDMIRASASFSTGHLKIMSRAYARESDQNPNDLAFIEIDSLLEDLRKDFPSLLWTPRIRFGGLLDIPDEHGETRTQGGVAGLGVDLFSVYTPEIEILNLKNAIVRGRLPEKKGEILISDEFASRLNIQIGETATLISTSMYGSMAVTNFYIVGTLKFGLSAVDRGAMLADISDIQRVLDMSDTSGEIVGFFRDLFYHEDMAKDIKTAFNARYRDIDDEFTPIMFTLREQNGLDQILNMVSSMLGVIAGIFVVIMSIVLWNTGLMGGLRRYSEVGIRLAMGEDKGHIYRSMIAESLMIGIFGTILGTVLGLGISYYLQAKGINISYLMENSSVMISDIMRARVKPGAFFIGIIPGILATFLGTSISGIGIYKRQTSRLMREFEK